MYVYNISGDVANIFYQSWAQIYNNQQVYEAQTRVPKCNSILKAVSHECQKLSPLHLDRWCMGEHTYHSPKATHLNVCMLSSVWARSCFWIGVSTPHQIFPHPLFLFILLFIFIIIIFTFILSKVAYIRYRPNYLFRFHICIKKGITTPLLFFCYFVSSWKQILIINFGICCKSNVNFSSH
jgi:hypothetical protein